MGLLTVSKKLEKDHPDFIMMVLRWLEKECNARVVEIDKGVTTKYYVEGDDIPKGEERFDIRFRTIVPMVFALSIKYA